MCLKISFAIILVGFLIMESDGLNILAITPHVGKSHQLVFEPLFKKLVSNEHTLTLITRFPLEYSSNRLRSISVANEKQNNTELFTFNLLTGTKFDRYWITLMLTEMAEKTCLEGLTHPNLQNFLKEDNRFDVILIETFNTNCFMGVAKKYRAPIIGLHSATWMPWMYQQYGVPYSSGALPGHFSGNTDVMNFFERLENTLLHWYNNLLYTITMDWRGNTLSKKYLGEDLYENGHIIKNVSLLLISTHFSINLPIALPPNVIEIGGIQADFQSNKKLPQDMEKFIKNSKDGVIYMSMGSTIRGDSFPEEQKQIFLKAFSKLSQRVIWKWEGEMKNKPDNVFITRWAPQRDVLCHPNVRVFITHAGLSGSIEGTVCGKPMLLLPQFGDQFTNAAALEKVGGGLEFILSGLSEEMLLEALKKLMSPQFAESTQILKERLLDRPISPTDTALYWIEYVVRHKGAPFLKTSAIDMPLYQYLLLDVLAFLIVFILVQIYLTYKLVNIFVRYVFRKNEKKLKKV